MFDHVPPKVLAILENNDLLVYSTKVTMLKGGPVLQVGAMFPFGKNRWEPLDDEENRELRIDVKKQLAQLGYRSKVQTFRFPKTGEKDVNDFRIKVLLKKGDIAPELVEKLQQIRRDSRREEKRAAQRARLAGQL